jgi:hypothetical protein
MADHMAIPQARDRRYSPQHNICASPEENGNQCYRMRIRAADRASLWNDRRAGEQALRYFFSVQAQFVRRR